jgi:hypothetical protein
VSEYVCCGQWLIKCEVAFSPSLVVVEGDVAKNTLSNLLSVNPEPFPSNRLDDRISLVPTVPVGMRSATLCVV